MAAPLLLHVLAPLLLHLLLFTSSCQPDNGGLQAVEDTGQIEAGPDGSIDDSTRPGDSRPEELVDGHPDKGDGGELEGDLVVDPGDVPAGDEEPDEGPVCQQDPLEPNDSPATAARVEPGAWIEGVICHGEEDWFSLGLEAADRVVVQLVFSQAEGDLDLALYDPGGLLKRRSDSTSDNERVEYRTGEAGRFTIQVHGYLSSTAAYRLRVDVEPAPPCGDDPMEENDSADQPFPIQGGGVLFGEICPADGDWFRADLEGGTGIEVSLFHSFTQGDLDMVVYRLLPAGLRLAGASQGREDVEEVILPPLGQDQIILVHVYGYKLAAGPYRLRVVYPEIGEICEASVSGRITYETRRVRPEGYTDPFMLPAAGMEVEVVSGQNAVAAIAWTDDEGGFSVDAVHACGEVLAVRLLARSAMANPTVEATTPARDPEVYAFRNLRELPPEGGMVEMSISIDSGLAGAVNIVREASAGIAWFTGQLDVRHDLPDLVYRWQSGQAFDCGSCYSHNEIHLGGGEADPDEFDRSIILHELGHYLMDSVSRDDSPGGPHSGLPAVPTLAWSEGVATFLSSAASGDPVYLDYKEAGTTVLDIESVDMAWTFGTHDQSMSGHLSEHLVSALLWDLLDEGAEELDSLAAGPADVIRPMVAYLPWPGAVDRGYFGVDLSDYLDGWFCLGQGHRDEVAEIVIEQRRFPYDFAGPQECDVEPKPGFPGRLYCRSLGPAMAASKAAGERFHCEMVPEVPVMETVWTGRQDRGPIRSLARQTGPGPGGVSVMELTVPSVARRYTVGASITPAPGIRLHHGQVLRSEALSAGRARRARDASGNLLLEYLVE